MNSKKTENQVDKSDRDTQLKKFYRSEFELYEECMDIAQEKDAQEKVFKAYERLLKAYYKNLRMSLKITNIGDSTQNKLLKTQEALRNQEEKLRAIFDNAISSIITIDLQAKFLSYNNNWLQMINQEDVPMEEKYFHEFLHNEDKEKFIVEFDSLIKKENNYFRLLLRLFDQEKYFWSDCSASIIHNKENNPESIIIIINNIDEQIKTQEKLAESYLQLKNAQDEILKLERETTALAMAVTANHEINQPLMVIKANLDMLKLKIDPNNVGTYIDKYMQRIDESVDRISSILDKFKKTQEVEFNDYGGNTTMVSFNYDSEFDDGLDDPFDDL
ncbi:MAG: PAS domain S-box protein [Candidatus Cloacimonadales bacterium]|jgi:PAS domain S-box-containing protein|nr:PAS domain S-box protein [Candidatus Cloacimonadales bacterium]